MVNAIAAEETIRDLRKQIEGLSREDESEVVFKDMSKIETIMLYRMIDGEPVRMSRELATTAIKKMGPRGPHWTTKASEAPPFVEGKIPCFLHADAPERDVLAELGLPPVCDQGKLRNAQAKRVHAIHCHKDEWAAYQEYLSDEAIRKDNERRDLQIDATLALAGRAAGVSPEPVEMLSCECGWDKGKNQASLDLHKRLHCPLKVSE